MSDDWGSRKVEELKQQVEDRVRKERLEYDRSEALRLNGPVICENLLAEMKKAVDSYETARSTDPVGLSEMPELLFHWIRQPHAARLVAPQAILEVGYDSQGITYKLSRAAATPQDSPSHDSKALPFLVEGDHMWLKAKDGSKLSVPVAAAKLLDLLF